MRKMEYDLVIGEYYTISNCIEEKQTPTFTEDNPRFLSPGIRLSVIDRKSLEFLVPYFSTPDTPEFSNGLKRYFRGEETDWRITGVDIDSEVVVIDFANENLWREAIRTGHDLFPENYIIASFSEIDAPINLKIEVELANGNVSTTLVKAGRGVRPKVTELGSNYQRIIEFIRLTEDEDGNYVHIIEYTW